MSFQFLIMSGLLAQGRVSDMSSGFRSHKAMDKTSLAIFVGIVVAVLAIALIIQHVVKVRMRRPINDKRLLFNELCTAHRLSFPQRSLLKRLVAAKKLTDPTRLFLDSQLWMVDTGSSSKLCQPATMRQIMQIRRKLFPSES